MKQSIAYGYNTPEFDRQLAEDVAPIKRDAKKDGTFFGKKNRPTLNESSFTPYIGGYKARFEEILIKKLDSIKPEVQTEKFNRFKEQKAKREQEIDADIQGLEHENHIDQRSLDGKSRPETQKRSLLPSILLGLIYLGECYYNALAFAFLGGNMIGALLIGITVTIAEGILAFTAGKILSRAEQEGKTAYLKAAPYALIAFGIVVAMSVLRSRMQDGGDHQTPTWIFFCVNIGFLVATIAISRILFSSAKEQAGHKEACAIYDRIDEREKQIKVLRDEKTALEKELEKEEEGFNFVISKARRVEEVMNAHFREAVEGFKTENLITRPDLGTPVCFFETIPQLQTDKTN